MNEENETKDYSSSLFAVMSPPEVAIMMFILDVRHNLPNDVREFPISYCDLESAFGLSPTTIKNAINKFSMVSDYNGKELQLLKVTFKANGKPTYYKFWGRNFGKLKEHSAGVSKIVNRNYGKEYTKTVEQIVSDTIGRAVYRKKQADERNI